MFSRFDSISECDRHTTTAYTALSIVSHSKNQKPEKKLYREYNKPRLIKYITYDKEI